ncbi:glycoside hydrolase family protein [Salix suchowensis]|nr:glycoside hydrolase family protein [Salix suchowensis]
MKCLVTVILFFLWMVSFCSCRLLSEATGRRFNVLDYGADGNGKIDATPAFQKAWGDFCQASEEMPTLVVPAGNTFLLKSVTFSGPCMSKNPHVLVEGTIVAPDSFDSWDGDDDYENWIGFTAVFGLMVDGGGKFDGQGQAWWKACNALHFNKCNGLRLSNLHHVNSQRGHISINACDDVQLSNLQILAPDESPNTDGIDISGSNHVNIQDSFIGTGDDCIAINGFSTYINVTGVKCGPGHGISIGSLGKDGAYETVEEVHVKSCALKGTQNGVRIKTWEGGSGYVRKITFEDITFVNSENPIIIDQQYNPNGIRGGPGIKISDITYRNVHGSSADEVAITLDCAGKAACTNIVMDNVNIISSNPGKQIRASCNNAKGTAISASPMVPCLSS